MTSEITDRDEDVAPPVTSPLVPGWWSLDDIDATWVRDVLGVPDAQSWLLDRMTRGRITQAARLRVSRADGTTVSFVAKCVDPGWTGPTVPMDREHRFHLGADGRPLPICRRRASRLDTDAGVYWLVFDDNGPGDYGDDVLGPDTSAAILAMAALATIHREFDGLGTRPDWLDPLPVPDRDTLGDDYVRFVRRYGERIDPVHLSLANKVVASIDTLTDHASRLGARSGIVHGDFRFGNIVIGVHGAGQPVVVTNWSHVTWGPRVVDLASFLALSFTPEERRRVYDDLLRRHLVASGTRADADTLAALRREIHDHAFLVMVQVIRCAVETPGWEAEGRSTTDLWLTFFARVCTFVEDLGRPDVGSAPGHPVRQARPVALADEYAHPDSVGDGRSEEWTLAVTDVGAGVGVWVRFGRHAALDDGAYVAASITGPDLPTVTLSTLTPDLDESLSVIGDGVRMQHTVADPLRHVHLRLTGRGDVEGTDVGVVLDLHWYTSADPALYGITPLLLIPAVATGTVTLSGLGEADRRIAVDAPGYREHAWAGADWWDMRWTAFVAHFDDHSQMNGIDIRAPGLDPLSLGHLQSTTAAPTVIDVARVISRPDGSDRRGSWAFAVEPGAHTVTFTPTAVADALRPGGPHGVDALMCRTWGTFTRNDGRRGVGWVETKAAPLTSEPPERGLHDPSGPAPNL